MTLFWSSKDRYCILGLINYQLKLHMYHEKDDFLSDRFSFYFKLI